jgi:FHA domain
MLISLFHHIPVQLVEDLTMFGKSEKCNFVFELDAHQLHKPAVFSKISNRHFSIFKSAGMVYIEDHSINGTFVNGIRVGGDDPIDHKRQMLLMSGDKITIVKASGPRKSFFDFFLLFKRKKAFFVNLFGFFFRFSILLDVR